MPAVEDRQTSASAAEVKNYAPEFVMENVETSRECLLLRYCLSEFSPNFPFVTLSEVGAHATTQSKGLCISFTPAMIPTRTTLPLSFRPRLSSASRSEGKRGTPSMPVVTMPLQGILSTISHAQKRAPVVIDRGFGQERADFI